MLLMAVAVCLVLAIPMARTPELELGDLLMVGMLLGVLTVWALPQEKKTP